jgi:hypothetical protein
MPIISTAGVPVGDVAVVMFKRAEVVRIPQQQEDSRPQYLQALSVM